jgi:hypothetical protein
VPASCRHREAVKNANPRATIPVRAEEMGIRRIASARSDSPTTNYMPPCLRSDSRCLPPAAIASVFGGVEPGTLEGSSLEQATARYCTVDDTACQSAPSMQPAQQERKWHRGGVRAPLYPSDPGIRRAIAQALPFDEEAWRPYRGHAHALRGGFRAFESAAPRSRATEIQVHHGTWMLTIMLTT